MNTHWLVPNSCTRPLPAPRYRSSRALFGDMDRLFDDVWRGFGATSGTTASGGFAPSVDIEETESEYVVTAELPGLDEKDFEVLLEGDLLTIKGEKKFAREEKNLKRRLSVATKQREIAEGKIDAILGNKSAKRKRRKKRTMSAAARKSIGDAQRKRWAKFKAKKKSKE